ncbi:MAG: hypothetical protein MAG715_00601 [Methanonatronarchaeales archaeon]|nr:hypothetical protein [Methanonatronarchaeales archaeon]
MTTHDYVDGDLLISQRANQIWFITTLLIFIKPYLNSS